MLQANNCSQKERAMTTGMANVLAIQIVSPKSPAARFTPHILFVVVSKWPRLAKRENQYRT
jgi:hypothetical protein